MADPISLTSSIAGIAALADVVVTKGNRYLKEVLNCEEDVRRLIVECNALHEVLERLSQIASKIEDDGSRTTISSLPTYIYECQRTLNDILRILVGFERKAAVVEKISAAGPQPSLPGERRQSIFSRVCRTDLKWPFSKKKTIEMIQSLDRLKSTCGLALATKTISAMFEALECAKLTKDELTNVHFKQQKIFNYHLSSEEERIVRWLSDVNPAQKHSQFRSIWQPGTGRWIFDEPQYRRWVESQNSALFIHGIPGAGKTILASTIIEEISAVSPHGLAYFYVRYSDYSSQRPLNILGSLLSQLAMQNVEAMMDATRLYAKFASIFTLSIHPTEIEFGATIQNISRRFPAGATLIIDGLDECGTANDREKLVSTLATINDQSAGSIRILVLGRAESDIREGLSNYSSISIAATSKDLQLFVASKIPTLKIKNNELRAEVIDALTFGADGMFQWTKCQIDYLRVLPNDHERRKALRDLPPDLPGTYIAILERIDRAYPEQTRIFIQRILIWLTLKIEPNAGVRGIFQTDLGNSALAEAICVEGIDDDFYPDRIPDLDDMINWCSSLVSFNERTGKVDLSHFSVREFLLSEETKVESVIAKKYLVQKQRDTAYLADVCLSYLTRKEFGSISSDFNFTSLDPAVYEEFWKFRNEFPFYTHAALLSQVYLPKVEGRLLETSSLVRFLTTSPFLAFNFWTTYFTAATYTSIQVGDQIYSEDFVSDMRLGPLQYASLMLLTKTVQELTSNRTCPAILKTKAPPIQLAVSYCTSYSDYIKTCSVHNVDNESPSIVLRGTSFETCSFNRLEPRMTQVVCSLVQAGADVNFPVDVENSGQITQISSLGLAILFNRPQVALLLLECGADTSPTVRGLGENFTVWRNFISKDCGSACYGEFKEVFGKIIKSQSGSQILEITNHEMASAGGHAILLEYPQRADMLFQYVIRGNRGPVKMLLDAGFCPDLYEKDGTSIFVVALKLRHWEILQELLNHSVNLSNSIKVELIGGICKSGEEYYAHELDAEPGLQPNLEVKSQTLGILQYLLRNGVSPNSHDETQSNLLSDVVTLGLYYHTKYLIEHGANPCLTGAKDWGPVHFAAMGTRNPKADLPIMKMLIRHGADVMSTVWGGQNALHLAVGSGNLSVMQYLLDEYQLDENLNIKCHFGEYPLHFACSKGNEAAVELLLSTYPDVQIVNAVGDQHGTPLHTAVARGDLEIVRRLVSTGADVDKIGFPGYGLGPPLFLACAYNWSEIAEFLLSQGAKMTVEGMRFKSAMEVAKAFRQDEMVVVLQRWESRNRELPGRNDLKRKRIGEVDEEL